MHGVGVKGLPGIPGRFLFFFEVVAVGVEPSHPFSVGLGLSFDDCEMMVLWNCSSSSNSGAKFDVFVKFVILIFVGRSEQIIYAHGSKDLGSRQKEEKIQYQTLSKTAVQY
ncbi:hypothetical protein SLA2020_151560 [Shorea laevis]